MDVFTFTFGAHAQWGPTSIIVAESTVDIWGRVGEIILFTTRSALPRSRGGGGGSGWECGRYINVFLASEVLAPDQANLSVVQTFKETALMKEIGPPSITGTHSGL